MEAPPISLPALPPPSPTEYQQAFAGKEDKIVWYKFHELPNIAPRRSPKARQPPRAAVKAKQSIVSSPKNAPARSQVVWTPAPAINDLPPLDLPNLLAVRLPPRQFTTPPDLVRADTPKIGLPDAPETLAGQLDMVTLPAGRLPPRPFSAPQTPPKLPAAAGKIDAPDDVPVYQALSTQTLSAPATKLPAVRLPSRPFVPPSPRPAPDTPPRKITGPAEAPAFTASAPAAVTIPAGRLPARAFAPPPAERQVTRSAILPPDEPAPPPFIEADPGDLTVAIASLNPVAAPVKLPAASSPAQFSAGEKVRPNGADADGADIAITAPDLYAHAGNETKPDLVALAYAAPTSKEALQEALRYGRPTPGDAPAHPSASAPRVTSTRVASAPDPRFNGRDIYMIAIQMPNLTSYSGSWLMWLADRAAREGGLPPIAAPVPHRKVDPKYIPAEVEEHVEGRVQLYCVIGREGTVTSIQLLRGIDDRLDRSAEEALSKWEFYPATRNGQPVDVDVVVEIPFVLAPRAGLKR